MKNTRFMTVGAFFVLILLFTATTRPVRAADVYAIVFTVGDVKITSAGASRPALPGMKLNGGETIVTGANSMADLSYGKSGYLRIQEKSRVSVASLKKRKGDADLGMESGRVMVVMSKLSKKNGYAVKTDTHVASIRGTVFQVSETGQESQLDVLFGSVAVNPVWDGVVKTEIEETVGENQSLTLTRGMLQEIIARKKRMSLSELRKEIRESMMNQIIQLRDSPQFKELGDKVKKEIDERVRTIQEELKQRNLDRTSIEEKLRQERERIQKELRERKK